MTWYMEPDQIVQMVCDQSDLIITQQKDLTDMKTQCFLPLVCDHSVMGQRMQQHHKTLAEAQRRPVIAVALVVLQSEQEMMIPNACQSGEYLCGLRMQSANTLTMAARVAPAAPLDREEKGQKFTNSTDFSWLHSAQWRD